MLTHTLLFANARHENDKLTKEELSEMKKDKYLQIFNYLKEFSKLRSNPVRDIDAQETQYPEKFWLNDIPENVLFENNSAGEGGGGMSINDARVYLENVTITENHAQWGGGLSMNHQALVEFDTTNLCNIFLNTATDSSL